MEPEARNLKPESRISNPESRILNPESRVPNSESRIPNPKTQNQVGAAQDSKGHAPRPRLWFNPFIQAPKQYDLFLTPQTRFGGCSSVDRCSHLSSHQLQKRVSELVRGITHSPKGCARTKNKTTAHAMRLGLAFAVNHSRLQDTPF